MRLNMRVWVAAAGRVAPEGGAISRERHRLSQQQLSKNIATLESSSMSQLAKFGCSSSSSSGCSSALSRLAGRRGCRARRASSSRTAAAAARYRLAACCLRTSSAMDPPSKSRSAQIATAAAPLESVDILQALWAIRGRPPSRITWESSAYDARPLTPLCLMYRTDHTIVVTCIVVVDDC